jgi:hypothetical protein
MRQEGEGVVVVKTRDDELFFYLPVDTVCCRSYDCLAKHLTDDRSFVGVARMGDLERFEERHPELRLEVEETIRGLDLGHGRWTTIALFRSVPPQPEPREAPASPGAASH